MFLGRQYAQHKQQCPVPAELEHDLSAITPPVCLSVGLSRLGPAAATWFRHGKTTYTGVRVLPPARGHRTCVSRQQRKRARYVSHLSVPSLVHRLLFVTHVHPYSSVPKPLSHKRFPFSLPYLFTHNHKSFTCFIALLFSPTSVHSALLQSSSMRFSNRVNTRYKYIILRFFSVSFHSVSFIKLSTGLNCIASVTYHFINFYVSLILMYYLFCNFLFHLYC